MPRSGWRFLDAPSYLRHPRFVPWSSTPLTPLTCLDAHYLRCIRHRRDARHIVASLFADGSPVAMSAAAMIQKGVDRDLYAVALEPEERDAILTVLENPTAGLEDLRGVLALAHRVREG